MSLSRSIHWLSLIHIFPYVENEAAYHTGTFNDVTYFDKIDAIKNGDIDTFNELLHNEGISKWDLDDFEELCDSYDSFISKANKELGDSVDATYGIKGQAEEWGDMTLSLIHILNLVDLDLWYLMTKEQVEIRIIGLKNRYPERQLVPFARRDVYKRQGLLSRNTA